MSNIKNSDQFLSKILEIIRYDDVETLKSMVCVESTNKVFYLFDIKFDDILDSPVVVAMYNNSRRCFKFLITSGNYNINTSSTLYKTSPLLSLTKFQEHYDGNDIYGKQRFEYIRYLVEWGNANVFTHDEACDVYEQCCVLDYAHDKIRYYYLNLGLGEKLQYYGNYNDSYRYNTCDSYMGTTLLQIHQDKGIKINTSDEEPIYTADDWDIDNVINDDDDLFHEELQENGFAIVRFWLRKRLLTSHHVDTLKKRFNNIGYYIRDMLIIYPITLRQLAMSKISLHGSKLKKNMPKHIIREIKANSLDNMSLPPFFSS